jgi:hypothetical protein
MIPLYLLERVYLPSRTLGSIISPQGGLICKTLELPWKDNQRSISCIIEGKHLVTKEDPIPEDDPNTEADESGGRKPRPYKHFRLHKVPGRSGVLIHPGVDIIHSLGCILPGGRFANYNTATPTLADSKKKLEWMVENLPEKFYLLIEKK